MVKIMVSYVDSHYIVESIKEVRVFEDWADCAAYVASFLSAVEPKFEQ